MAVRLPFHYQIQSDHSISCYGNSYKIRDFIRPLRWFPGATDQIVELSLMVDRRLL